MLVLNSAQVREALSMSAAIKAMRSAFAAFAEGKVQSPQRASLSTGGGVTLVMPAVIGGEEGDAVAVKVVSVFPENSARNIPAIHGLVLAVEPDTGRPSAILDGGALTAIRTAAVCALATDALARPASRVLAVIGSGVQARTQVEAICNVRSIDEVRICNPRLDGARRAAEGLAGKGPIPLRVTAVASSAEALRGADIVCTATTATDPVLADAEVEPGTHINAIGSYQPHVRELPPETVARCLLVVDEREAALEEAGDIIQPIEQGIISQRHIHCELGDLVLGRAAGRGSDEQITLFKSVGLALQDVAASQVALREARRLGLGLEIDW